jgi:hypothetical protein
MSNQNGASTGLMHELLETASPRQVVVLTPIVSSAVEFDEPLPIHSNGDGECELMDGDLDCL